MHSLTGFSSAGQYGAEVKEQMNTLKCILGAFMLRRTKSKLIECGTLVLPPLTEITMFVFHCLLLLLIICLTFICKL